MDEGQFHQLMRKVAEADDLEEERRQAAIRTMANQLKADRRNEYVTKWEKPA